MAAWDDNDEGATTHLDPALGGLDEKIRVARHRASERHRPLAERKRWAARAQATAHAVYVLTGRVLAPLFAAAAGVWWLTRRAPAAMAVAAAAVSAGTVGLGAGVVITGAQPPRAPVVWHRIAVPPSARRGGFRVVSRRSPPDRRGTATPGMSRAGPAVTRRAAAPSTTVRASPSAGPSRDSGQGGVQVPVPQVPGVPLPAPSKVRIPVPLPPAPSKLPVPTRLPIPTHLPIPTKLPTRLPTRLPIPTHLPIPTRLPVPTRSPSAPPTSPGHPKLSIPPLPPLPLPTIPTLPPLAHTLRPGPASTGSPSAPRSAAPRTTRPRSGAVIPPVVRLPVG